MVYYSKLFTGVLNCKEGTLRWKVLRRVRLAGRRAGAVLQRLRPALQDEDRGFPADERRGPAYLELRWRESLCLV